MIVCSCRAVSDHALREAAAGGASHDEVVASTGVGTDCGHCRDAVAEILSTAAPHRCGGACASCPRRVKA